MIFPSSSPNFLEVRLARLPAFVKGAGLRGGANDDEDP